LNSCSKNFEDFLDEFYSHPNLITAYQNLHIFAYYRGGVNLDMIKAGIKSVEEIINTLEK
jgi:hypothetical protein